MQGHPACSWEPRESFSAEMMEKILVSSRVVCWAGGGWAGRGKNGRKMSPEVQEVREDKEAGMWVP